MTFADLAARYIKEVERLGRKSWKAYEGYLRRPIESLGSIPAKDVKRIDLTDVLSRIAKTAPVSANRTQTVLRAMFGQAVNDGLLEVNPLAGARKIGGQEKAKDRVLSDDEIAALWRALDDDDETPAAWNIRLALKTNLLTCARPGEVAAMGVAELTLEGKAPTWLIPAHRSKNGRAHLVPLSDIAHDIIHMALARTKAVGAGAHVFCSKWESAEPIARHSLSQATRRMCAKLDLQPFTPHDLRRTGATLARAEGAPRDSVAALLNHKHDDVTSVYDRYSMLAEKRDAANKLAARISRIVGMKRGKRRGERDARNAAV